MLAGEAAAVPFGDPQSGALAAGRNHWRNLFGLYMFFCGGEAFPYHGCTC